MTDGNDDDFQGLLDRLRQGDQQALATLFSRHRDRLRRMIEFRLDARLRFNPLSPVVMQQIVDKFVRELAAQLAEKNVKVEITEAARQLLGEKGFDPAFGARPLGRVIEESVKRPLTDELLFGALENGGTATVDAEGGEIVMRYAGVAA